MFQMLEQFQIWILNFNGVQTFLEKSIKLYLHMIYLDMNLYLLTFIQILEVPLQVEKGT
jgi:hypothetical protein